MYVLLSLSLARLLIQYQTIKQFKALADTEI